MPWFRVDDNLTSHPKARKAGLPAMGLWVVAGAYSMNYLTEGFVPEWYVLTWPNGKKLAGDLVKADLWSTAVRDGEKGWQFHQWHERQPSKEQIETDRELTRQRVHAFREKRRNMKRNAVTPPTSNAVTPPPSNGVTGGGVTHDVTQGVTPFVTQGVTVGVTLPHTQPIPSPYIKAGHDEPERHQPDPQQTTQTLLAEWIDHCSSPPPSRVKTHVAREVKTMLTEGIPYELVRQGLAHWNTKGLHPSVLPSVVHEVANAKPRRNGKQADTDALFAAALQRAQDNPTPTGAIEA